MTTTTPAIPRTPLERLRWALTDSWTITQRDLSHWARQPTQVIVTLLFPVMLVLMFGYLFGGQMQVPGGGDYREFLLPGMFAMTMVFGLEATMIAVTTDAAKGVTDRFRSLPIASSAVVAGRSAADMLNSAVGLLLLLRFAVLWVGIYLGLLVQNPEAVIAVQILVWPFGFLSNAFAAPATMPGWLGAIAEWNPLSATVAATRELFGNPGWGGDSWIAQHSVLMAVGWPLLLVAIFFPLSVRRYRRLSR